MHYGKKIIVPQKHQKVRTNKDVFVLRHPNTFT